MKESGDAHVKSLRPEETKTMNKPDTVKLSHQSQARKPASPSSQRSYWGYLGSSQALKQFLIMNIVMLLLGLAAILVLLCLFPRSAYIEPNFTIQHNITNVTLKENPQGESSPFISIPQLYAIMCSVGVLSLLIVQVRFCLEGCFEKCL